MNKKTRIPKSILMEIADFNNPTHRSQRVHHRYVYSPIPKILIVVEGGSVSQVMCNNGLTKVTILDMDVLKLNGVDSTRIDHQLSDAYKLHRHEIY